MMLTEMPEEYMKSFESTAKVGLIATITPEGLTHISLISSIQGNNSKQLIWGQFIEGKSKENVKNNPKTAFFIMNLKKEYWRGKAVWTHEMKEGPEYIMYNKKPLYRYNTYVGIHTVHFMDLVEISEKSKLNIAAIVSGSVMTKLSKGGVRTDKQRILKPWGEDLLNNMESLKFISYIERDGFPVIIPVLQAQCADSTTIAFSTKPFGEELKKIPEGVQVSLFGMALSMEDILVQGEFTGFRKIRGVNTGTINIEKVYNPMPPKMGYIYPEQKIQAITEF